MGESVCIYVRKDQVKELFWVAQDIVKYLGNNRWHYFKEKFKLDDEYPNKDSYWTADQIVSDMLGKEIKEEYVRIIKNLAGKDCIIQGDYAIFPKDKKEEDYVDLDMVFYELWQEKFASPKEVKDA